MMNCKHIIFFLLIVSQVSCAPDEPNWFDLDEVEVWKDNDEPNPNTKDNRVYMPGRAFVYKIISTDVQGGSRKCEVLFNKKCITDKSVNCIDYQFSSAAGKYLIDHIQLYVYRTNGHNEMARSQSIIKYAHYDDDGRKILQGEQTGVVEDSSTVFLHPPRSYCYAILEFAPFPVVNLPLKVHDEWSNSLSIPKSYIQKLKIKTDLEGATMDSNYKVVSCEPVETPMGDLNCFKIIAEGSSELGTSKTVMFFDEVYGFVKIDYYLFDGSYLSLQLTEVTS